MKKIIMALFVVIILVFLALFSGLIPSLSLLDDDTETNSYQHGEVVGCYHCELIQPNDKKGFILSWKDDGHSETISIRGKLTNEWGWNTYNWLDATHYKYKVYLKKNLYSAYELKSEPGSTSKYFSNPNPGVKSAKEVTRCQTYDFDIIGSDYANGAIKAELWAKIDKSPYDTQGSKWYRMASDEAYLYSGYGGLYLPRGIEEDEDLDTPYSTFEIGQTVRIGVETAKGGETEDGNPWRVTLNEPYSGTIDTPDDGGGVVLEETFPDDCDASNTFFEFTVTEEMALKSMSSPYFYSVRIWNTILPRGTLQIDFVDFLYKCPGNVDFTGPQKTEVDKAVNIELKSTVNDHTQADIDYFRVSVIYGTNDVLLPSDWGSNKWIIHTTNVGDADRKPCSNPVDIGFTPTKESYITVHAKAVDVQGRPSKTTRTFTLHAWKPADEGGSGEPPDEVVDDETGQGDYGGGHTDPWLPWDPSGGNWEDVIDTTDWTNLIVAIVVFFIFFQPVPRSSIKIFYEAK